MKKSKRIVLVTLVLSLVAVFGIAYAADTVPPVIDLPGTQPNEVGNLESPDKCDNCHGGYDPTAEPAFNWRGSMMANAGRDPIFWATLAIAEQDFDGAGDLCIRCHSSGGWVAGRSTPTDGSGLAAGDDDGIECDLCHKMTNPNNSEHIGAQNLFFPAYDPYNPAEAFLGSGMYSLWAGSEKLGPFTDAQARHQWMPSQFHRSVDFCGTCHDVSNSAVGHFAPNHGAQPGGETVVTNGPRQHTTIDPITLANEKYVALNNPAYRYGIVERTFSEFKSAQIGSTLVSDYLTLPADLQDGALKASYESAILAGTGGNYADGDPRYFSCQTCHMRPITGAGCNKAGVPVRPDLPLHDQTGGGGYWMTEAIQYLDTQGKLRLGGGLSATQIAALQAGALRSKKQLAEAASLVVDGDLLTVTNLTGHKLITGYPEGRRMWIRTSWYDGVNPDPIQVDGEYGPVATINFNGQDYVVNSLIDPYSTNNTRRYDTHYGMTQDWAAVLVSLGYSTDLALSYDRYTGAVDATLGQLASGALGTEHETFHFVLNNTVVTDTRIPPYGMSYAEAERRNALPVPDTQYGCDPSCTTYDYHDYITLNPPAGATYATIELIYQPTSWEYIQFLWLGNNKQNAFLANEGDYMLEAWLATNQAEPFVMVSTAWGTEPQPQVTDIYTDTLTTYDVDKQGNWTPASTIPVRGTVGIIAHVVEPGPAPVEGAQVFMEIRNSGGALVTSLQGFSDADGNASMTWKTGRNDADDYTATVTDIIKSGYEYSGAGQTSVPFTVQ